MKIRLDNKFNAFPNKTILGYVGETNARTITFSGLSVSGANSYSMVIDYGDGENYEVNIVDGVYTVDASVLKRPGLVNCQVLAKALSEDGTTYTIVKKSNIFALNIGKSIGPGAIPTYEQATSAVEKLIQINPNAEDVLKFTEQIDRNVDDIAELSGSVEELKGDLGEKANQYFINNFVRTSRSNNLLYYQSNVHDSELSSIDGSVISNQNGYCSSDFIPIGYEQIVMFSHSNAQTYTMPQVCTYSLNKTFIRKVKDVDNITLTANEYFIKVCFKQSDERIVQISLNERYDYEQYQNIIETVNKKTGKKWCAVGDSLTDPWFDVYASFVADKLGMILTNRGIGGTCVAQNNNATVINAFVDRIPTYTDYYDVWSIFGGENDAANNTPIGDISSMDKTTFYGAYNVILGDLLTRTNRPTIILITPYQTKHNVKPYRDAVIKIGELYGLPVIDLYANSGINIYTRPYYLRDDVHPNQNGVNKLRPYILRQFSELCLPEITPTMPN